jgi:hypothetical protein
MVMLTTDDKALCPRVDPLSQSLMVIWLDHWSCDDTDLVTNLVTKQNADLAVGVF